MKGAASDRIEGCGDAATGTAAVDTEHVLREEYCWLWPNEDQPLSEKDYYRRVADKQQAALCLSGGGIRSAAFGLGVLQALSRKKILTGFHYLSTVSGGGYIGSFVQRWIKECPGGANDVMSALGDPKEQPQIKRLRENSNFITPRVGLGSNDTWTAVAISLRNIIINWFLFLPLFLLVAVLPNWFLSGVDSVPTAVFNEQGFEDVLLLLAATAIAISVIFTVPTLPSYRTTYRIDSARGDGWLFVRIVLPVIAWSVFGTLALSADLLQPVDNDPTLAPLGKVEWGNGVPLAVATLGGMMAGFILAAPFVQSGHRRTFASHLLIWLLSFLVAAGWVWLGAQLFSRFAPAGRGFEWAASLLTVLGPLWLLTATLVASIVFTAFASALRLPFGETVQPDSDREWIARVSGIKFKPMLAWALAGVSALLLTGLLYRWTGGNELSLSAVVALLAGGGAVAGGKSERSGGVLGGAGSYLMRVVPLQTLVSIATLLFVVALFVLLGGVESRLVGVVEKPIQSVLDDYPIPKWIDAEVVAHSVLLIGLALLLWAFALLIPVNRFSLNGLYRNRLARAFLGAARPKEKRSPNPFTGFDSADNIRMHLLATDASDRPRELRALYPIVNCALNVTATENLAWQERKAEPFIFSPLFSGSGMLDPEGTRPGSHKGAYVSSRIYGGSEPDLALGGTTGVTLGTAVAISGAAASPNMGYHSSPATAFLMTLFNVRLGAWLPNPALAKKLGAGVGASSPSNSLRALLRELAGSTDDRGVDIYLSDGGHFENLAVYEMLRRRCRYIVVSDAGADPNCAYSDLGGAVRKAKIDLDVQIDFREMCISSRDNDVEPQLAWAIGDVTYRDGEKGEILYIKPSFFGKALPVDVVAYARESATFPHESTADQWFSESQFESYRRLGFYFADQLAPGMKGETIAGFFDAVREDYAQLNPQPLPPVDSPARRVRAGKAR